MKAAARRKLSDVCSAMGQVQREVRIRSEIWHNDWIAKDGSIIRKSHWVCIIMSAEMGFDIRISPLGPPQLRNENHHLITHQ